jgi:hypothetical protein
VRRSPALVEQTKFCQQKRASADTGGQLCALILLADPVEQAPILAFASRPLACTGYLVYLFQKSGRNQVYKNYIITCPVSR